MGVRFSLLLPLTLFVHWMLSVIRDLGAGLCLGESHAVPASGGCVLPPLSPAVFQPGRAQRIGKSVNCSRKKELKVEMLIKHS